MVLALFACGGADRSASHQQGPQFSLADTLTAIGVDDGTPGHSLYQVRNVVRAANGRLFVADGSSGEVRVFDQAGLLTKTIGGRGAGPGEHRALGWVAVSVDRIQTYDGAARRITTWTHDGTIANEFAMSDGASSLVTAINGGTYLGIALPQGGGFPVGTSHVDTLTLSVFRAEDQGTVPITQLPFRTRYAATLPDGTTIYTPLPLEPQAAWAASTSTVYVGYPDRWMIRRFDLTGRELEPIAASKPRQPLTDQVREAWKQPMIDRVPPEQRPDMIRYLADLPYSDSLPAFDTILVDDLELLWVRQYPTPGQDSVTWRVVNSDGAEVGHLTLRPQQRLFQVGEDYAIVGDTRADGAEIVVVLRLRR